MTDESNLRARIASHIAGVGCYVVYLSAFVVVLALLIRGLNRSIGFVVEYIDPWASFAAIMAVMIGVPLCLLLSIPRRFRGVTGALIFGISCLAGLSLWIRSVLWAYALAGPFWLIVGVFLGGVGVVPVAFIAAVIQREWGLVIEILIATGIVFGLRFLGAFIAERAILPEQKSLVEPSTYDAGSPLYEHVKVLEDGRWACLVCREISEPGDNFFDLDHEHAANG